MSRVKLIANYALAYVMWIVSFLLWLWFMLLSREAIAGLLTNFYLNGSFSRMKAFQFFNQWYFYLMGLVWLIFMIGVENYFRQGIKKGNLLRRISQVIGPELFLLSITNLVRSFILAFTIWDWLILGLELILGAGLVWWTMKIKPPTPGILKANP